MRRLLSLVLLATLPVQAQELGHLQSVHSSGMSDHLQLVFECDRPPVYNLYAHQDKLVVELVDCDQGSAHSGGVPHGATDFKLRQTDMSHVQACLGLKMRLPREQVKASVAGNTLRVDLDLSYQNEDSFALTPGIRWLRRELCDGVNFVLYNELSFDPADPKLRLDVGLAQDRLDAREKPTSMIARNHAVAAVNGGYFASAGGPLGLVVRDGKVLVPQVSTRPPRTALAMHKDRKVEFETVVAKGGTLSSRGTTYSDISVALGGGPRLLHRGQLALTTDAEELGPKGNDITRSTSRTALATTRDGRMLVATATGYRDTHMQGVRLEEMATLLLRRGAAEAMNLDGGSSTVMAIGSHVVSNGPGAPNFEKSVATTVMLADDRPATFPAVVRVSAPARLSADGSSKGDLVVEVSDPSGRAVPDGTPVRLYADGVAVSEGVVKTRGGKATGTLLAVRHPGSAKVRVECGGVWGETSLRLDGGPAARLLSRTTPPIALHGDAPVNVPSAPPTPAPAPGPEPPDPDASPAPSPSPAYYQRSVAQQLAVTVQVNDSWGNPVAGVPVQVLGDAGAPLGTGVTGSNGQSTSIVQLPLAGARLQLVAQGLAPQTVTVPPLLSP